MKALLAALDAQFDDAEGGMCITGASWDEAGLTLHLSVTYHDDCLERWEISCAGAVEESLHSGWATGLDVSTRSALLTPFSEPDVPIMFSQNEMRPEALFGIVCSCCIEVMGRAESISRFLHGKPTARGMCSSPYGLLGRFPASLATRIIDTLQGQPIRVNALEGHAPRQWSGSAYAPYPALQVLQIGQSYVIAERFSSRRM